MTERQREKRWLWWGQARDCAAAVAGLVLVGTETYRGTYNTVAMVFAAACLGIVSSGFLSRWLIGRWEGKNGE